VDDFLVTCTDRALYASVFAAVSSTFKITDYDGAPVSKFCGVRIHQRVDGAYVLDQEVYIDELLERLGLSSVPDQLSPEATGTKAHPLPPGLSLARPSRQRKQPLRLLSPIGRRWALYGGSRAARARIYFVHVNLQQVAVHVSCPAPKHWRAVRRIYAYLKRPPRP
jgi:hypothetical protein